MIFAPHTLQIKVIKPMEEDEFGHPIPSTEYWQDFSKCRCDDISAEKKASINGNLYDYKYKVVYESVKSIEAGTLVRCVDKDGKVRGEGIAKNPMQANYFLCKTLWLE